MRCDHQIIIDHLADYIGQNLSPTVSMEVERAISSCPSCQASYQQALKLHHAVHNWREQPVPDWHRTEYAVRPQNKSSTWLNWSALTTSCLALVLVLFQVQITSTDSEIHVAFGGKLNHDFEGLLDQKMKAYKTDQSLLFEARLVAEIDKHSMSNRLLIADAIEKTRAERREDLNFIVTGFQSQRFEDKKKFDQRLTYLAENQIENNQYINNLIQANNLNGDL